MGGAVLRLNSADTIRHKYFDSVGTSMITLMVKGIMLDEVGMMVQDMVDEASWFPLSMFCLFVIVAYFNLLNMLVGAFCSVSMEVSVSEKDVMETNYLRFHLAEIVDAYLPHDGSPIERKQYDLIMRNPDVH